MPFCTGQGLPDVPGGCCHLGETDSGVCPHYRSADTVADWINSSGYKGAAKSRLVMMAQGALHVCTIAMRVYADDVKTGTDRALFEQRWHDHPDYQADVRPTWTAVEERMGYPPDSYNCPTYQGGGSALAQDFHPDSGLACCFGQDEATCDAQAANLHATAVTVRRAGGF